MKRAAAKYLHCTNCGTEVHGAIAKRAADPNTVYCKISGDRLVNSRCPNSDCPLFNKPQNITAAAAGV